MILIFSNMVFHLTLSLILVLDKLSLKFGCFCVHIGFGQSLDHFMLLCKLTDLLVVWINQIISFLPNQVSLSGIFGPE